MKVNLNLSIEKVLVERAKREKVNISELVEQVLADRLKYKYVGWVRRV